MIMADTSLRSLGKSISSILARFGYHAHPSKAAMVGVPVVAVLGLAIADRIMIALGYDIPAMTCYVILAVGLVANRVCVCGGLLTALLAALMCNAFFECGLHFGFKLPTTNAAASYTAMFLLALAVGNRDNLARASKISTVRDVVNWLGGPEAAATWAGVSSIEDWLEENQIPPGLHLRLILRARAEGYDIPPAVFGLRENGTPVMPSGAIVPAE